MSPEGRIHLQVYLPFKCLICIILFFLKTIKKVMWMEEKKKQILWGLVQMGEHRFLMLSLLTFRGHWYLDLRILSGTWQRKPAMSKLSHVFTFAEGVDPWFIAP
jgi:hypothetical protein